MRAIPIKFKISTPVRCVLGIAGVCLTFGSTYRAVVGTLTIASAFSYSSLALIVGIGCLEFALCGRRPHLPAFHAEHPINFDLIWNVAKGVAWAIPPLVLVLGFENWVTNHGYRVRGQTLRDNLLAVTEFRQIPQVDLPN